MNCECVIGMPYFTLFTHLYIVMYITFNTHTYIHLYTCLHYQGTTMEISPWAFFVVSFC